MIIGIMAISIASMAIIIAIDYLPLMAILIAIIAISIAINDH